MGTVNSVSLDSNTTNNKSHYRSKTGNADYLEEKLEESKNKQGIFGNTWNNFKELTNLGQSASDCESMVEKYKSGKITFEEAVDYINSFESKQENMKGLLSNILTGIGSIAATVALYSNPASIGLAMALQVGAPTGAAIKTGLNLLDRSTNKIEGDEFNAKTMAKDALSGAVTGATSAISSGISEGIKSSCFGLAVKNGVKCGTLCGAASGSSSYLIDTAFKDKEFDFGEFTKNTATSALISGTVGGIVGAGMYGTTAITKNIGENAISTTTQNAASSSAEISMQGPSAAIQRIVSDSTTSSTRKVLGQIERNIIKA